jgi:opacity protein-like surface antigen
MSVSSAAVAAEGLYVSGFLGLNVLSDSDIGGGGELTFDAGPAISGAVGFSVMPNVRVEGELAYRTNDIDKACKKGSCAPAGDSMSAFSLMGNGFYDFDLGSPWRPYLGGGIGFAVVTLDPATGIDDDDTVLAVQFGGGVGFDISERAVLTLDYRLLFTDDPNFSKLGSRAEYISHTLAVGLRYHF